MAKQKVTYWRGQPWVSFYPALQVLTLNLVTLFLCRGEWLKGAFKPCYALGCLWTFPCVKDGGGFWQCRCFAGKMLLCQSWTLVLLLACCTINVRNNSTICSSLHCNQCLCFQGVITIQQGTDITSDVVKVACFFLHTRCILAFLPSRSSLLNAPVPPCILLPGTMPL